MSKRDDANTRALVALTGLFVATCAGLAATIAVQEWAMHLWVDTKPALKEQLR